MLIQRTSEISGIYREMDLPVTEEQLKRWKNGELAQNVFSHLSPNEREFIITGATQEEWDELFPEEDDILEEGDAPAF